MDHLLENEGKEIPDLSSGTGGGGGGGGGDGDTKDADGDDEMDVAASGVVATDLEAKVIFFW